MKIFLQTWHFCHNTFVLIFSIFWLFFQYEYKIVSFFYSKAWKLSLVFSHITTPPPFILYGTYTNICKLISFNILLFDGLVWFMVFNVTFNNISAMRSVLLVEETGVPGENQRPVASHWQTLSHDVVLSTPRHERGSNSQL